MTQPEHSFAWGDEVPRHQPDMDCPCRPFMDWDIKGSDRHVVWVVRHPRMPRGEANAA